MSNCWEIVCTSSKSKKKYDSDDIIRVKPGCKLKVRLLGRPVKVVRAFTNDRKYIVLDNEEIRNISVRYASWCFDRNSDDMRILDMPVSVARGFGNRVALIGKKISTAKEGCDWAVITNGKKNKNSKLDGE